VGTSPQTIIDAATELLGDRLAYAAMATAANPFGDGHAAARIEQIVEQYFQLN
jgi:UDP-N-acetylglucosamine 2-epimerase (non-hydrolysing)